MLEKSVWLEINLRALARNTRLILENLSEEVELMAVVKSNAYGHGLKECALTIWSSGAHSLCVNSVEEAVILRELGIKAPILILGYIPPAEIESIFKNDLEVLLYDLNFARLLESEALKQGKKAKVHIKLDTGMHRLGVLPAEITEFMVNLKDYPSLEVKALCSHLAAPLDREYSLHQIRLLKEALFALQRENIFVPMVHMLNSKGTFLFPDARFDGVRIGRALFGLEGDLGTSLVMSFKTRVVQVKSIPAGETVGYDRTYKTKKRTFVAVISAGYADGYPRSLSNKGEVLINGKRCPIIGRVCMSMSMVDVSGLAVLPKPGQEVVLMGESGRERITPKELADLAGVSDYEIVVRMRESLPRIFIE